MIPGAHASNAAAPAGQVWGLALPSSVKSVKQSQLNWLAGRRVTTVVAVRLPQKSLIQLVAGAKRARLNVIVPSVATPRSACRSTSSALRRCAAVVPGPEALAGQGQGGLGLLPALGSIALGPRRPRALDLLRGGRDLLHRGLVATGGAQGRDEDEALHPDRTAVTGLVSAAGSVVRGGT